MIPILDAIGPAIWRASWQATFLALLIAVLLKWLGDRITSRARYLIWSIVLVRLIVVVTPSSPLSAFNLVAPAAEVQSHSIGEDRFGRNRIDKVTPDTSEIASDDAVEPVPQQDSNSEFAVSPIPETEPVAVEVSGPARVETASLLAEFAVNHAFRILTCVWLVGCLVSLLRLSMMSLTLYRRLSACRPVTDPDVLQNLEILCWDMGIRKVPRLLVTPESISPCLAGFWSPRIVVPETILTEQASSRLQHVLVHELAHLVRGDLWMNWVLLLARTVYWFNPVMGWVIREMQAEREAACDDLSVRVLGESNRWDYAQTIVDLASNLARIEIAPAFIGLISSARRLTTRIDRLVQTSQSVPMGMSFVICLVLGIAVIGLTDSTFPVRANALAADETPAQVEEPEAEEKTISLRGRCLDHEDKSVFSGVTIRLFKAMGKTAPIVEIAKTQTDQQGEFEFPHLAPPRTEDPLEPLEYLAFVDIPNRPIGSSGAYWEFGRPPFFKEIRIPRNSISLSGTVVDARGKPVSGATIVQWQLDGRSAGGFLSATSDDQGHFMMTRIPDFKFKSINYLVSHPDFPQTKLEVAAGKIEAKVVLPDGCRLMGTVTDRVTGKPAARTLISVHATETSEKMFATSNVAGQFQLVVPEGRYHLLARRKDRVCVAVTDQECQTGETKTFALELQQGGFIAGQVTNTATDQPVSTSDQGHPITIGLFGPSEPGGRVISPIPLATVDAKGRFKLRAAPGENFPFFVNTHGVRMAWDTKQKAAVIVKEGETTSYDMLITPPETPEEKLKRARELLASLPQKTPERIENILSEFRKLDHTVDETEIWCLLMHDLVGLGREAVPQICDELDRTTSPRTLRRLGFALRAIGDPRAVPALIRAIPKTLLPSSSDYGLLVGDAELLEFMQKNDLNPGLGGQHFDLGRPVREIFGAIHKLTGKSFDDDELFGVSQSPDPRRVILQRRLYEKHALAWQSWWEDHWQEQTKDAAYAKVKLTISEETITETPSKLGRGSRVEGIIQGATLSPAIQEGRYADHFTDLDTGYGFKWPDSIPKEEARVDQKKLADWALEKGIDLMCVTHKNDDGNQTFVLRQFGMKVWEIGPREFRNIDKLVASGLLPEGREVGELLMHYDGEKQKYVPDANATFLFITRQGNMGIIETTDRINRTADITGLLNTPEGVGFHKGVKYNLKAIIP